MTRKVPSSRASSWREGGFSFIEALAAVTILAIAIVLSIQPIMSSLRQLGDSRAVTVAENLAQAEIESIRALEYGDIGFPGYTPMACWPRSRRWRSRAATTGSTRR